MIADRLLSDSIEAGIVPDISWDPATNPLDNISKTSCVGPSTKIRRELRSEMDEGMVPVRLLKKGAKEKISD